VAISKAPEQGIAGDEAGPRGAAAAAPITRRRRWFGRKADGELRIYQHSNLLYWWPIWVYGFVCAALTYVQGIGVSELAARTPDAPHKVVLFHPSPWLGISFI